MGVMPLVPVLASAPTQGMPYGLCNFVLVKEISGLEVVCFARCACFFSILLYLTMIPGHFVAQIRLVFEPLFTDRSREPDYLAYIEPLQPSNISTLSFGAEPIHIRDESSGLYKVSRLLDEDGRDGVLSSI